MKDTVFGDKIRRSKAMGLGPPYISFCYSIAEDRDDVELLMGRVQNFFLKTLLPDYDPDLDFEPFFDPVLRASRISWSHTCDGSVVILDCNSIEYDEVLDRGLWERKRERFKQSLDAISPHLAMMVEEDTMPSIGCFNEGLSRHGFTDFYLGSDVFSAKFADSLLVDTTLLTRTEMQNGWYYQAAKFVGAQMSEIRKIRDDVAQYIVEAGLSGRRSRRNNPSAQFHT